MFRLAPLLLIIWLWQPNLAAGFPPDQDDHLEALGAYVPTFFAELQDVELMGTRAYVFGVGGLAVLELSIPEAPVLLGRYEPPEPIFNRFYRGAVEGNLALGGGREDLLSVMQLIDLGNPILKAVHGQPGQSFEGVALRGGIGYACRHSDGLEIIDFEDKQFPVSLSEITTLVNAWDVDLLNDHAYVADGAGGLAVIDVSNLLAPVHLMSLETSGSASDVVVGDGLLVVCCGSAGIDVFTLDDPANPVLAGHANTSGLAITASVAGSTVYVADWDDVEAFDLSNPSNPVFAGGENTPFRAMGLAAKDDLVVVADWSRVRTYRTGPTLSPDIEVSVEEIVFNHVPLGGMRDTTFTIGNTGGSDLAVGSITVFSASFEVTTENSFILQPGQTREVGLRFSHVEFGFDGTFLRIDSADSDEAVILMPISGDNNPNNLDLGQPAPDFTLTDMGGVVHNLHDYQGRVVVLAFFANW